MKISLNSDNGAQVKLNTVKILVLVLALGGFHLGCSSDPTTNSVITADPDTGGGGGDGEDVDERDVDDGGSDITEPDIEEDSGEDDVDDGPEVRTCPEDIQDSCVAPPMGCMGDARVSTQCVSFNEPGEANYREIEQFSNGAVVNYRLFNTDDGPREFRTAYGPDGERCYTMLANEDGDTPQSWSLSEPQFGSFQLDLDGSHVVITCTGILEDERCTRARLDNAFALFFERPEECEPYEPDDLCSQNDECGEGEGCCRADGAALRQCLPMEFCIDQQEPIECETSGDCTAGETCARCTRSGVRECIPDEIVEDEDNSLGCVEDSCLPGGESCDGDRTCCEVADVYQCIVPAECSTAPDPNPVCNPDSSQACAVGSQECCFVEEVSQFRCLSNVSFCQTNVCFGDSDCSNQEECCGYDADAGRAGSCASTCEPPDNSCETQADCFGDQVCCKPPGYTGGECVANEMSCQFTTCETTNDCGGDPLFCCDEAPLTEGICLVEGLDQCPPPQ